MARFSPDCARQEALGLVEVARLPLLLSPKPESPVGSAPTAPSLGSGWGFGGGSSAASS